MDAVGLLTVYCDEESAQAVSDALESAGGSPQVSRRKSFDGASAMSWLVVAAVAARQAPDLVRALGEVVDRFRVESVELDGVVIRNPRGKDVDKLLSGRDAEQDRNPGQDGDAGQDGDDADA